MHEAVDMALEEAKAQMEKALHRLNSELKKVRAGKAHPSMLEGVKLDYYGSLTPIGQVANVNSTDARTIVVQPWEKSMLDEIATGIINANLGLNPMNNGEVLIINAPAILNAANEVAVARFLKDEIQFYQLPDVVESTMGKVDFIKKPDLDSLIESDRVARLIAAEF